MFVIFLENETWSLFQKNIEDEIRLPTVMNMKLSDTVQSGR
jgi:Na+-translocating ferredoxin:NAD+ oxidoreductase RnfE subunit